VSTKDLMDILLEFDAQGKYIYTVSDLAMILEEESRNKLNTRLRRLVQAGILERVARGVYLFAKSRNIDGNILESIAVVLRRNEWNFLSFESALSEYGVISQIPLDRITVATTGRRGEYWTSYGVIEFTHTTMCFSDIFENTRYRDGRVLPIATKELALRQLRRSGRNTNMIEETL